MNKNLVGGIIVAIVVIAVTAGGLSLARGMNQVASSFSAVGIDAEKHQILLDACEEKKQTWSKALGQELPNDCEAIVQLAEESE